MSFRAALFVLAFFSSGIAHAYNIAYWERKVPQSPGKVRVEHVVLNESGRVWFEALIDGEWATRRSGYFDDIGQIRASELKIDARTIMPTQFNEPEASRTNSPVITMTGVENSSECSTNQPFKVVQGRGLGPIFAVCESGRFYLEESSQAKTIFLLMKDLLQKAEQKSLIGVSL